MVEIITRKLIAASVPKGLVLMEDQNRSAQVISLVAKLPTKMDLNHPIPILLRFEFDTNALADEAIPEVRVIRVKHIIASETHLSEYLSRRKPASRCCSGLSRQNRSRASFYQPPKTKISRSI